MATYTLNSKEAAGVNPNKQGIIKPDEQGRYRVTLGALEYPNSIGAVYDEKSARDLLNDSNSIFVRKLRKGCLIGELSHPTPTPGMKKEEYYERIVTISELRESHTILEVTIDTTMKDSKGNRFVGFSGLVKPSGPYGHVLKEKFADPDLNLSFSICSLTRDEVVGGVLRKYLVTIVTWDAVGEPGLAPANKWDMASMESIDDTMLANIAQRKQENGLESTDPASEYAREVLRRPTQKMLELSQENASYEIPVGKKIAMW